MDARVVQVDGGAGDGGAAFVRERVVPTLRGEDGSEGILHVADREGGRGYSITFWRDSGALEATNPTAADLREEAGGQGYDVSLLGQFNVDVLEIGGGEPQVARVVRFTGGPDLGSFIRDKVSPTYQGLDGYVGVLGLRGEGNGIGISLWASDEAFDAAEDAMRQVGQSMEEAGYQRESLERLAVEMAELPSG
jgi:hypothetical protein